ncbi:MAG TPA: alpha/beta hydrolase domain-containing protein [Bryobacteraceae bacterium]|nr:alpha/beta hydrolase domain-containing protein [Bryobacteraceae bacterium]
MKSVLRLPALTAALFGCALIPPISAIAQTAESNSLASASGSKTGVPNPQITGPIGGGDRNQAFGAIPSRELERAGYQESEYFYGGTARAFINDGPWGVDGVWAAKVADTAPYKVRMLVRRPIDPRRFNGIVIVEWLNVTALVEGAAEYIQTQELLLRDGYAWVGLGVQAAGVNTPRSGLKAWDAARYASLEHPGDHFAWDIYSQGGQALRHPHGIDPLNGLKIDKMIAAGRSQSAAFLIGYINAVHPIAHVYDGYFVHSRVGGTYGFPENVRGIVAANPHIRTDIDVPVFDLQMEGDYVALRSHLARQPDSRHFRLWEVAGGAHSESPRWVIEEPPPLDHSTNCKDPINAAPGHAVVKAALHALVVWVRDGQEPPKAPLLELGDPAAADPILRDKLGNAKGGIRLPEIEVPTASVNGLVNSPAAPPSTAAAPNFCRLFGTTVPFDKDKLAQLYPTHESFVKAFDQAVDAIEHQGFWLKPEADAARKAAAESHIPR